MVKDPALDFYTLFSKWVVEPAGSLSGGVVEGLPALEARPIVVESSSFCQCPDWRELYYGR